MFIGHFAVAFILAKLFPEVPILVPLTAVSFPDLLWPLLVLAGVEKVRIDPDSPLQMHIGFLKYPYSHSLVLTNVLALVVGVVLAWISGIPIVALVFVLGSASHWLLDAVVHLPDLPVLGFSGGDKKVGLGLWRHGPLTFALEFIFYAAVTVTVLPGDLVPGALFLGAVFHLINANSFFGFTKKNPFSNPSVYALLALLGFGLFIFIASSGFM